jgi:hypothetical protein
MTIETIFTFCNILVLPGWALLILLPRWKWTLGLISAGLIPFVLALVYAWLFAGRLSLMPEGGGFGSLPALMVLFTDPALVTVGWIHYLAFDLFVGCWEVNDSRKQGINHWLVIPCLLLTFLLGPIGLALYFVLRAVRTGNALIYPST